METKTVSLTVRGMTCASCVAHVEKALLGLEDVVKASVNLATGTARVEYFPGSVSLGDMKRAVRDIGYEAEERVEGQTALDREREARQKEIRRQGRYMLMAWPLAMLIMAGTFRDYWILANFVPEFLGNKWVLGLLTTPIVFGPGRQFFVNSFRGLVHGATVVYKSFVEDVLPVFADISSRTVDDHERQGGSHQRKPPLPCSTRLLAGRFPFNGSKSTHAHRGQ
jgi:cation transport ATPase